MSNPAGAGPKAFSRRLLAPLAGVRTRLRGRPDSEHELTINRLALSGMVFIYLVAAAALGSDAAQEMLRAHAIYFGLYYAASVAFFAHILYRPGMSPMRRIVGIFFDIGMFSYGMHLGDEATAPFFPIYLWVVLGNGFRFGIPYLITAATVSVAGFGLVMLTTEIWQQHQALGFGLLASLVFLPLYVSTLIRKLSAAKRQAEEASKAKTLFLASVSHELRTPLNAIIGLSDLLLGSRLDAEQKDMTRTIGRSGRSLLALINSILDFSRIEANQMPKNSSVNFDLHSLVFEIRKMLGVQADAKAIRLAVHIAARVPRWLNGPRQHLHDILMNLTANAVKFTERGYVVIGVDASPGHNGRVRLRFEVTDTGIGIAPQAQSRIFDSFVQADETIIDRFGGTGLGLALVKQLVELHGGTISLDSAVGVGSTFSCEIELEAATSVSSAGSIGGSSVVLLSTDDALRDIVLSTGAAVTTTDSWARVEQIIAECSGDDRPSAIVVDARSSGDEVPSWATGLSGKKPGSRPALILVSDQAADGMLNGPARSRFVTVLRPPLDAAALLAALQIARGCDSVDGEDDPPECRPEPGRKLSVLVAEDNRTNQKVITKILERAGHRVRIADNGEVAMDALSEQAFDIVLMDVNMPVMNGIETTKLYRFASLGQPRIPIIALTADATPEMEERCREAGMDGCLTKPIEPARLIEIIHQMVDEHGTHGAGDPASREGVIEISDHPKFSAGAPVVLNTQVLDDLGSLGGNAFVEELADQFVTDARVLVAELEAAVAGDARSFRERAHALRSAAANIGAQGIFQMCVEWRQISACELEAEGKANISKLKAELARVGIALDDYRRQKIPPAAEARPGLPAKRAPAAG